MIASWRPTASLLVFAFSLPAFAQPMTAVLRLKERVPLEQLAQNVKATASTHFGKFYSPEEIRDVAAPFQDDYDNLIAQLQSEGFEVVSESPTHLWISVKGEPQLFEKAFNTQIKLLPGNKRKAMTITQTPENYSAVASVVGLDNTHKMHPLFKKQGTITSSPGGFSPKDIKTAYGFNGIYSQGVTGKGQHIAIATYDGFQISDVTTYYSKIGLSPAPSVDQVTFNGTPAYSEGSATETELDAEFAGMMAPGASVHVFASATNDEAGEMAMFTAVLDDNRAKVVNYSWGMCESGVASPHAQEMDKVFARAVAQGVNITVASGDSGSDSCQDGSTVADWPAANANVVAVGGTTLQYSGSVSTFNEAGWSGSGGGISSLWNLPTWQTGLPATYAKRSYPDVSFNADPASGQAIWTRQNGRQGWMVIGGTSMAAPQWAGYLALVGEARAKAGKGALGFLNPILYGMSASERSTLFNDVTSGNNGAYDAAAGWDAVTGFGSMQATALLNRLSSL